MRIERPMQRRRVWAQMPRPRSCVEGDMAKSDAVAELAVVVGVVAPWPGVVDVDDR